MSASVQRGLRLWTSTRSFPMPRAATRNLLLAALTDLELKRWNPHLQAVQLAQGQVLHEPGQAVTHVYFPTTAIVSLLCPLSSTLVTEVAMVGSEGIVCPTLLVTDDEGPPGRVVVQSAGWAFRMSLLTLRADVEHGSVIRLLLRHAQALVFQISQRAACCRHHSVIEQMCRWLLLCLDRTEADDVTTTQSEIAAKLGVRRAGVSECAHLLQERRLIKYSRGHISVINRAGLEQLSCECYALIRKEYKRLGLERIRLRDAL